ncbi:MAG TPA: hypothetical protein PKA43_03780 [Candidatus Competibacter phosphatis]|nr:hypothetical protein [Candidatus Competibacter phosphatis]
MTALERLFPRDQDRRRLLADDHGGGVTGDRFRVVWGTRLVENGGEVLKLASLAPEHYTSATNDNSTGEGHLAVGMAGFSRQVAVA